jgi:hypothetical protein
MKPDKPYLLNHYGSKTPIPSILPPHALSVQVTLSTASEGAYTLTDVPLGDMGAKEIAPEKTASLTTRQTETLVAFSDIDAVFEPEKTRANGQATLMFWAPVLVIKFGE